MVRVSILPFPIPIHITFLKVDYMLLVFIFNSLLETVRSRDVRPQKEKYLPDYNLYHNLSQIQIHMKEIANQNPSFMRLDWMYRSREDRPQLLLRVTNFTDSRVHLQTSESIPHIKVRILLSFGEHAREFLPIESMFHLLLNLTQGLAAPEKDPAHIFSRAVLLKMDLFIVAVMNPDGRLYVERTQNYCWRGTGTGVDLNRNFDWTFGQKGSSGSSQDEEYRGTSPFSEPECRVLVDLTARFKFDAFVSLHSGIRQIYVPFADSVSKATNRKPYNIEAMLELADLMSHSTSQQYTYGLAYQLNEYTADGTIFDYMAGIRKIPFSYAIELWGHGDFKGAKCFDVFNPMSQHLKTSLDEIHPLYVSMFLYLIEWKHNQVLKLIDPSHDAPSLSFGYALLVLVVGVTVFVAVQSRLPLCMRMYPRRRIISLRALSSTFSVMTLLRT